MGKTTVAVNLAYALARRGTNLLLIDTDPQGSVGLSLSEKARKCQGFYEALNGAAAATDLILSTRLPEFNVLPAGHGQNLFEARADPDDSADRVRRVIESLAPKKFDLIIVDTPAGLHGVTGDVLRIADWALVPQQAEPLGIRSIPQMLQGIQYLRQHGARVQLAGILMTMVQHDQRESVDVVRELRSLVPPKLVLDAVVPRDPVFLKAAALGVPLGLLYQQPPAAAHIFDQLAAELDSRMQLRPLAPDNEHTRLMD